MQHLHVNLHIPCEQNPFACPNQLLQNVDAFTRFCDTSVRVNQTPISPRSHANITQTSSFSSTPSPSYSTPSIAHGMLTNVWQR